jgi:hypothetical protein
MGAIEMTLNGATLEQLKATWFDLEMETRRLNQLRMQVEQAISQKVIALRQEEAEKALEPEVVGE